MAQRSVIKIAATNTVLEAAKLMAVNNIGALLVFAGDKMVGIVTERDILTRLVASGKDQKTTLVGSIMTPEPKTVKATQPFVNAITIMHDGGFRHVPVVDGSDVVGMVSVRDAVAAELEEDSQLELG